MFLWNETAAGPSGTEHLSALHHGCKYIKIFIDVNYISTTTTDSLAPHPVMPLAFPLPSTALQAPISLSRLLYIVWQFEYLLRILKHSAFY